ncbi:MAG: hypothetical protein ACT4NL_14100 [Pseudomarimonas sp.]
MFANSFVWLVLTSAVLAAPTTAAEFTAVDPANINIGCTYSRSENQTPFLVVRALLQDADGPRVFLGLDGEDLAFEIEDEGEGEGEGEPSAAYKRANLRLVVHFGASIEQDCGDDCAGTLRKVRVELDDGTQRKEIEAIEHCGC